MTPDYRFIAGLGVCLIVAIVCCVLLMRWAKKEQKERENIARQVRAAHQHYADSPSESSKK